MKHKNSTLNDYRERINETLCLIHSDVHQNFTVEALAFHAAMSPFHFNRIFKEIVGESVHAYCKRFKLEHAANLLIFNPNATITQCMQEIGFSSSASFTQAFKERFLVTPSKWREIDRENENKALEFAHKPLHVKIASLRSFQVAYVRHLGYDRSIKNAWLKLEAWASQNSINFLEQTMIGLHHSNPRFVEASLCHYVACLELPATKKYYRSGDVGVMKIPETFCAIFSLQGKYGDLKKYMDVIYHDWLPKSAYEKIALPSFALYAQNHFINANEAFDLEFCIPVRFK